MICYKSQWANGIEAFHGVGKDSNECASGVEQKVWEKVDLNDVREGTQETDVKEKEEKTW